jgi:drug/metabolite transporter (DMT)-like permease
VRGQRIPSYQARRNQRASGTIEREVTVRIVAAYALMCAIWGTTWVAIKVALTGLPPLGGAGIRFIIAGLVLYAVSAVVRRSHGAKPPLKLVLVLAATLFGCNYALTYFAETQLASGLVAVLFGTMPFFVFGFGALMLRETITRQTLAGAVLALAGVVTIAFTGEGGSLIYVLAALTASALSAFANVYLKRYAHHDPLRTLPPAMLVAGVTMTLAGALLTPVDLRTALALPPILATLYLAIFGSAVAFYLNHWLLQRLTAWIVGLEALIIPVIAVIVGAVVAHEAFGVRELIGAALVVAGVCLALVSA